MLSHIPLVERSSSLLTHDGEDDDAGEHGRCAVGESNNESVSGLAEGQTEGEEDLRAGLQPDQRISKALPLTKKMEAGFCCLNQSFQ